MVDVSDLCTAINNLKLCLRIIFMGSVSTRGTTSTALPECSRSNPTNYQPESNLKALDGNGKLASKYCIEEDKSVKNGPSASTVIIHSNETRINYQKDKNIMIKQVKSKEKDPCAICLGSINDETELDNCTHTFCFICTCEWLKNSGKCPLCKAPVMQIKHSLHKKEKLQQVVLLSTLQAEAEAARLSARGSSQPPHDEITCIQLRIRRIQKKISHIQHMMNKNKAKYSRSSDLARLNEQAVDELNRLDLLKREAASMTRGELLGNLAFRRIIYEDNLDWSPIDRNAIRVPFTPANCLASESESRARLIPFINRELMIVWLAKRPNGKDVLGTSHRKQLAWDIISTCLNHQINSPAFAKIMRGFKIDPRYIDRFQRELFDFASSRLSMEDFDKSSSYSSADLRERQSRTQHNPTNSNDVVFLHDDSSIESSQDVDSSDLVVLDDEGDHLDEIQGQSESNFIRDEAISSGSEAEREFYARPACRIEVADAFGYQFRVGLLNGLMQSYTGGSSIRFYGDVQSNQLVPSVLSKTSKKGINAVRSTASRLSSLRPRPYTTESNDHVVYLSSDDEDLDVHMISTAFNNYRNTSQHSQQGNQYMQHINSSDQKWNQSLITMGDEQQSNNNDTIVIDDEPTWLNPYQCSESNINAIEKPLATHPKTENVENYKLQKNVEKVQYLEQHVSPYPSYDNCSNFLAAVSIDCKVISPSINITDERRDPHSSDKGYQQNEQNRGSEVFDEAIMNEDKTVGVDMKDFEVEEQLNNKIGDPGPVVSENVTAGKESVRNLEVLNAHDKPLKRKHKKVRRISSKSAKRTIEEKIKRLSTLQSLQKWSNWCSEMKEKCEEMMKTINEASGESKKHNEDKKGGNHRLCTSTSHAYDSERKRKHFTNRSTRSYSQPPIKRSCSSSSQMPGFSNYKPESLLQELQK